MMSMVYLPAGKTRKVFHTQSDRKENTMKTCKTFQWVIFVLVLVVGGIVAGCKDSDSPTTPEVTPVPTTPVPADGEEGTNLGEADFCSQSLSLLSEKQIGPYTFKVYADTRINAAALLEGITANDASETIQSKIDAKRIALAPQAEIVVDVAGVAQQKEPTPANVNAYLNIVRRTYWWNNYNGYNYYWMSTMSCNSATLFFRVISGSYAVYQYYDRAWRYDSTITAGTTKAAAISGYDNMKGFKGIGRSSSNRADIVMYFFR